MAAGVSPANRLDTLPRDLPALTLGWEAAAWTARFLRQPNGPKAGQPFVLTTRQLRFLLHWYAVNPDGSWVYHHGVRRLSKGAGKALALDTPLPTPVGWVTMGDVRVGDQLLDENGAPCTILAATDVMHGRDCYRVTFRDGSVIVADGDHLWPMCEFVGSRRRRERSATTREMFDAGITYPRTLTSGKTKASKGGVSRWKTLSSPALDLPEAPCPLPPYLLGYWLGDGDSDQPRITVSVEDYPHFAHRMEQLGVSFGEPKYTSAPRLTTYRVRFMSGSPGGAADKRCGEAKGRSALRELGLFQNKHIPPQLLRGSYKQRLELLQGLMDSDGSVDGRGRIELCVCNEQLARDAVALMRTLGLYPRMTESDSTIDGRVMGRRWRINVTAYADEPIFTLPRKVSRLPSRGASVPYSQVRTVTGIDKVPSVPVRCVAVSSPSNLYLAGEGMVPTHNSPFAAVIALTELLAPVRLDYFDPERDGGCKGKVVSLPLVHVAAPSEEGARHTFRMVRAFAPKGSKVATYHNLDPGLTRYYCPNGELAMMTTSVKTAEGAESSFAVADQTELWLGHEAADFMATIRDNLAKSGSRMLETANAWRPDAQSQAQKTWDTWVKQEEELAAHGHTKSGSMILYDAVVAPPETDLADRESLESALRFVYSDCTWKTDNDIQAIMTRIWDLSTRPDDSKRKYLNWPVASEDAWCDPQAWAALADPRELEDGERIVIFFDGSKTRDATAAVGCCLDDGYLFVLGIWEPHDEVPVDAEEIDNRISSHFDRFDVVGFFGDVREWEGYVKTTWPDRWADRLQVWAVSGGKLPEPIAWDMRSHSREFALAAEMVEAEIIDGKFTHDDNPVLARHIGNARRYETRWNGAISVKKETRDSPKKIDGCVAVIGARMVYRLALAGTQAQEPSTAFAVRRW